MVVTGFVFYSLQLGQSIAERRDAVEQMAATQHQTRENGSISPKRADIRSANAADDAVDIAFVQLLLSVFGLIGLGLTVRYARLAWKESERSADVAHAALAAATADSAQQAERFRLQLAAAQMAAEEAKKSNEIAAAGQLRMLRPYLYYTGARFNSYVEEGTLWVHAEVDLFNGGVTPAYITRHAIALWARYEGGHDGFGGGDSHDQQKTVGIRLPYTVETASGAPFDEGQAISGGVVVGLRYEYRSGDNFWTDEIWVGGSWSNAVDSGELRELSLTDKQYLDFLDDIYAQCGV